jgi:hypothetical protein
MMMLLKSGLSRSVAIWDGNRVMPETRVPARSFRDLLVWRKAHRFVPGVYSFTAAFPEQET